jgi:hypothetical protein
MDEGVKQMGNEADLLTPCSADFQNVCLYGVHWDNFTSIHPVVGSCMLRIQPACLSLTFSKPKAMSFHTKIQYLPRRQKSVIAFRRASVKVVWKGTREYTV